MDRQADTAPGPGPGEGGWDGRRWRLKGDVASPYSSGKLKIKRLQKYARGQTGGEE